ncbi:MAG: succinyl-CoA synthetase subunit beta [Paracoccaceae bacterium]
MAVCAKYAWPTLASVAVVLAYAGTAHARSPQIAADAGIGAFVANCFSPFMTAEKAKSRFDQPDIRYDFYDLDPFSNVAPSPASGSVTEGTDRRCEVAFDHDYAAMAADAVVVQLTKEGITKEAAVPANYQASDGTALLAARMLNPKRKAVVHVGTRPGPSGTETFMFVERLLPLNQ